MIRSRAMLAGVCALCLCLLVDMARAGVPVVLSGLFGDKALLEINGAPARVMRVGESRAGIKLVSVLNGQVVIEEDGQRRSLMVGLGGRGSTKVADNGPDSSSEFVVYPDRRGHFVASGRVNGTAVEFMVDTGASVVTLPKSVAIRAGVTLDNARRTGVATAGGVVQAWQVKLNAVQLGGIRLHLVDAVVIDDASLPVSLLGMSFLNRTTLSNDGGRLTLKQRY